MTCASRRSVKGVKMGSHVCRDVGILIRVQQSNDWSLPSVSIPGAPKLLLREKRNAIEEFVGIKDVIMCAAYRNVISVAGQQFSKLGQGCGPCQKDVTVHKANVGERCRDV
jgi:hypothetical protein